MKALFAAASAVLCLAAPAGAQQPDYPTKPITIVVPFAAGGTADIFGRMVAEHLRTTWNAQAIVENVGGGGSMIGINKVAKGAPDGTMLGLGSTSGLAINPTLYKATIAYDVAKDFAPLAQISMVANVLVVNPQKIAAKTVPELIAHIKANPGKITFGSAGVGTSQHLAGELFQQMAGVKMNHVPYKGSSQMLPDLLSGTIDLAFDNVPLLLPHAASGKLKFLATATVNRAAFDPSLPAVSETLPGFEAVAWHGFIAPSATPKPIVDKLSAEIVAFMKKPETVKRMTELGATGVAIGAAEFAAYIASENARWRKVIETANVKPE